MFVDPHQPYLWLFYMLLLFLYSAAALGYALNGDKSPIFSARNLKPRREIFLIHALFLGVMLNALLLGTHIYLAAGTLSWLTMEIGSRKGHFSPLDCAILAVAYVVVLIEQRFIYIDAKNGGTELPDKDDFY